MNELIPINDNEGEPTANARDLHEYLEVGKDFSSWIKDRIVKYGFEEGGDFIVRSPELASEKRGGQNKIEYYLSMDMAKELSMLENNPKGKDARKYFIAVEKAMRASGKLTTRDRSKKTRNHFTETLKEHGCDKPYHYINITRSMKSIIGIDKPKDQYNRKELIKTMLAETLAMYRVDEKEAKGYHECKVETDAASTQALNVIGEADEQMRRISA